ncbi:MAG TPA: ABC transporter permease [Candidatus Limnocylindrales bacterium]|nr:ABC transporter permease [Candidatus Limnocylindrales bacterium]
MIAAVRSELRKLLTVRSTYLVLGILVLFIAFGGFYIEGYSGSGVLPDNHKLVNAVFGGAANIMPQMIAIVVVLLMAHEYRYNLINYSLTLTNSRTKFLAAKFLVASVFTVIATVVGVLLTMGLTYLGLKLKGTAIPHQDLALWTVLWRTVAFSLGYSLFGLALVTLIRNLTAVIFILFAGVGITELLLGMVLKNKTDYLPFRALSRLIQPLSPPGIPENSNPFAVHAFGPLKALGIFSIYLAVLWVVSWILFNRRDAS